MPTRRRERFIHAQAAWMLVVLVGLAAVGALSLELFFVLSFIGLLVVVEFTAPFNVTPRRRRRLKWFIVLGLLVFVGLVLRQMLQFLPEVVG